MATNFEHYKKEILKNTKNGTSFCLVDGKVNSCAKTPCCNCDFDRTGCPAQRILWLYAEYKPQPKLTKKERLFCELVETGWISRDSNDLLYWYQNKVKKGNTIWDCNGLRIMFNNIHFFAKFEFIKWEDTEPWSVEDLLKLEVEE